MDSYIDIRTFIRNDAADIEKSKRNIKVRLWR